MRIFVKVKTGARETKVIPPPPTLLEDERPTYIMWVKERPVAGRANDAVIRALAEHFHTSPSQVRLISGATSRSKVFNIL